MKGQQERRISIKNESTVDSGAFEDWFIEQQEDVQESFHAFAAEIIRLLNAFFMPASLVM